MSNYNISKKFIIFLYQSSIISPNDTNYSEYLIQEIIMRNTYRYTRKYYMLINLWNIDIILERCFNGVTEIFGYITEIRTE